MLGMTVVSLLLLSALFSLGLLVSCRCHQSANALVLLLFLWVFLTLVIPSASPHLAAVAAPTPAAEEISYKVVGLLLQLDPPGRQEPTLDRKGFQERLIQLETEAQQRVEAQARLTQVLSCLSPVATGAHLMADLAGTGMLARSAAVRAIRKFQQEYVAVLPQLRDPVRLEALPRLRVPEPDLRETLTGLRPGLTVLLLYNVVLFLGAHLAFLRQDLTA
jgi:ABC-type transport system involved in multi-copper enzyme maturation permease subunit